MVSNEHFIQQYKRASPAQKYLFDSKQSDLDLAKIATTFIMQPDVRKVFFNTVSDIILGFYKVEDTVPLLQQELELDPKTAALLGAEVLEFLAPLSDPNWQPPVESEETDESDELSVAPQSEAVRVVPVASPVVNTVTPVVATPVPPAIPSAPAYATTSTTPSYQPGPATISEPTYQSAQPFMERPRPLGDVPSYVPPTTPGAEIRTTPPVDRPRWSTDV